VVANDTETMETISISDPSLIQTRNAFAFKNVKIFLSKSILNQVRQNSKKYQVNYLMNKLYLICFTMICCFFGEQSLGQSVIPYGSNGGSYVMIFNKKIYYEEYGKGVPLIMLEGGMKSIKDFSFCIPELMKHFRVIAPDDPGQGRSEMLDTMTYDLLADYASKLIDILKLDSAYVIGWSDGGIAALILSVKRPDKIKKVLVSGANYTKDSYVSYDSARKDSLELLPPGYQLSPEDQKWADSYFIANRANWRKIVNDRKVMWDQPYYFPKELFSKMKIPVMIVSGDRDMIKLEHSIEMYRLIKKGQLCILPNTSHDVFNERPELISEIATHFFEK
jgi:pimeloyl-ACP methyl ester carboxylesterase